jgi:hypothetical protein
MDSVLQTKEEHADFCIQGVFLRLTSGIETDPVFNVENRKRLIVNY